MQLLADALLRAVSESTDGDMSSSTNDDDDDRLSPAGTPVRGVRDVVSAAPLLVNTEKHLGMEGIAPAMPPASFEGGEGKRVVSPGRGRRSKLEIRREAITVRPGSSRGSELRADLEREDKIRQLQEERRRTMDDRRASESGGVSSGSALPPLPKEEDVQRTQMLGSSTVDAVTKALVRWGSTLGWKWPGVSERPAGAYRVRDLGGKLVEDGDGDIRVLGEAMDATVAWRKFELRSLEVGEDEPDFDFPELDGDMPILDVGENRFALCIRGQAVVCAHLAIRRAKSSGGQPVVQLAFRKVEPKSEEDTDDELEEEEGAIGLVHRENTDRSEQASSLATDDSALDVMDKGVRLEETLDEVSEDEQQSEDGAFSLPRTSPIGYHDDPPQHDVVHEVAQEPAQRRDSGVWMEHFANYLPRPFLSWLGGTTAKTTLNETPKTRTSDTDSEEESETSGKSDHPNPPNKPPALQLDEERTTTTNTSDDDDEEEEFGTPTGRGLREDPWMRELLRPHEARKEIDGFARARVAQETVLKARERAERLQRGSFDADSLVQRAEVIRRNRTNTTEQPAQQQQQQQQQQPPSENRLQRSRSAGLLYSPPSLHPTFDPLDPKRAPARAFYRAEERAIRQNAMHARFQAFSNQHHKVEPSPTSPISKHTDPITDLPPLPPPRIRSRSNLPAPPPKLSTKNNIRRKSSQPLLTKKPPPSPTLASKSSPPFAPLSNPSSPTSSSSPTALRSAKTAPPPPRDWALIRPKSPQKYPPPPPPPTSPQKQSPSRTDDTSSSSDLTAAKLAMGSFFFRWTDIAKSPEISPREDDENSQ